MINSEPIIKVALLQNCLESKITLTGIFHFPDGRKAGKTITVQSLNGEIIWTDNSGKKSAGSKEILLTAEENATFTLDVKIGIDFHWQQTRLQTFRGSIILRANPDFSFHLINEIPVEEYLASVISSEMSAQAPLEFLKAQAITARSWLAAMLDRKKRNIPDDHIGRSGNNEIIRWYDTNDHGGFDVCADDHCQRYQGIGQINTNVNAAIEATRGLYLVYSNKICDARYYKACGGRTEIFSAAWEDKSFPYLQSITDSANDSHPVSSEDDAAKWLSEKPPAYCNTEDKELLAEILPSFDQKTPDFYRWQVDYSREELEKIIRDKLGIDFGTLLDLIPLARGPSGRISKLKIVGTKESAVVGKELEIRRCLSTTHLLSSAFVVSTKTSPDSRPERFILNGGGWGHGVGLCQIGAAVMAKQGFNCEEILAHYFPGARIKKLYN